MINTRFVLRKVFKLIGLSYKDISGKNKKNINIL